VEIFCTHVNPALALPNAHEDGSNVFIYEKEESLFFYETGNMFS